jgi:iron complex outermembrane recepter protein
MSGLRGQPVMGGVIEGRIANGAGGVYLENVRVAVEGSARETLTNAAGRYRLIGVPAGSVRLSATHGGFRPQARMVAVAPGEVQRQDFVLVLADDPRAGKTDDITKLDTFTVVSERLSAQAAAINDQRVAPNLKQVVAFEEFGDMGESNPGEFLKYVPGISMTLVYGVPQFAQVRGMPPNGTLVTMDGAPIASSTGDRAFEFTGAATGNIDRIEVTKSPTPDLPANAIGGGINIVGKSGFGRQRPELKYSAFTTFSVLSRNPNLSLTTGRPAGPEPRVTASPVQPAFDLSYLRPVNDRLALTLAASASRRYINHDLAQTIWNHVTFVDERYLKSQFIQISDKRLTAMSADWRVSRHDTLRLSAQYSGENTRTANNSIDLRFGGAAVATGGETYTENRAASGTAGQSFNSLNIYRDTVLSALRYQHDGGVWKFETDGSYSYSWRRNRNAEDGFNSNMSTGYTGLNLRADGLNRISDGQLPVIVASTRTGAPVDVANGYELPVNQAFITRVKYSDEIASARASLTRSFDTRIPFQVKIGGAINRERLDQRSVTETYAVAIPGAPGANTGGYLGIVDTDFSVASKWYDYRGSRLPFSWLSTTKLYGVFRAHPEYFTLNQGAAHTTQVTGSKRMSETVTAGYVRGDTRLLANRLRVTTGVRYELTQDDGAGPLDDIGATYARDANGNILRTTAGAPIRLTTDALGIARLRYRERGQKNERRYDGYHPSFNASYALADNLILRSSYARTIARPPMSLIIPGATLSDPNSTTVARTITISNTGLRPWTAHNFDLTLEAYDFKGAQVSVAGFRKEVRDFFGSVTTPATPELLALNGLSEEYLAYDVVTQQNFGRATIEGLEWSYRQSLGVLGAWAARLQWFVNGTHLRLSGANADDFTNFCPQTLNWGVSFAHPRYLVKFNVARSGLLRGSPVARSVSIPEGTYSYAAPQTIVDLSWEYKFTKWLAVYASGRNANQSKKLTLIYAPASPEYSRVRTIQRTGALWSIGVKGGF